MEKQCKKCGSDMVDYRKIDIYCKKCMSKAWAEAHRRIDQNEQEMKRAFDACKKLKNGLY